MINLCIEDSLILSASKLNVSAKDSQLMEELSLSINDWNYFTDNAIKNGVGPIIYRNFSSYRDLIKIPDQFLFKFKQVYYKSLSRNIIMYEHFRNIISVFNKNKISVIALKGIFLADRIYSDIGLRQLSDIDILVKEKDAENSRNILLDLGYTYSKHIYSTDFIEQYFDRKHYTPLVMNGIAFELHRNIHLDNLNFHVNIEDYWNRSQPVNIYGTDVLALSPNDLLQHLCIHLDEHFNTGEVQLRSFCDIVEVLNFYKNEINWNSFEESCNLYKCIPNVYYILFLSHKYLKASIPNFFIQKTKLYCDQRKEDIFILNLQNKRKDVTCRIEGFTIRNIKKFQGFKNKIRYIFGRIFASKSFMYKKYKIKFKPIIYWYYIVRMFTAISIVFIQIRNRIFVK